MDTDKIRKLLESNSADIKYAKGKSLGILTDIEDKLGSIKAIIAGLEGYVESLELFYQENSDDKSVDKVKTILKDIDKLKINIELLRTQSGIVHQIQKQIKRLKS